MTPGGGCARSARSRRAPDDRSAARSGWTRQGGRRCSPPERAPPATGSGPAPLAGSSTSSTLAARGGRPGWPYPMRSTICGVPNRPSDSRSCSRAAGTSIGWDSIDTAEPGVGGGEQHPLQRLPGGDLVGGGVAERAEHRDQRFRFEVPARGPGRSSAKPARGSRSCGSGPGPPAAIGTPSGGVRSAAHQATLGPVARGRVPAPGWRCARSRRTRRPRSARSAAPASAARRGRPRPSRQRASAGTGSGQNGARLLNRRGMAAYRSARRGWAGAARPGPAGPAASGSAGSGRSRTVGGRAGDGQREPQVEQRRAAGDPGTPSRSGRWPAAAGPGRPAPRCRRRAAGTATAGCCAATVPGSPSTRGGPQLVRGVRRHAHCVESPPRPSRGAGRGLVRSHGRRRAALEQGRRSRSGRAGRARDQDSGPTGPVPARAAAGTFGPVRRAVQAGRNERDDPCVPARRPRGRPPRPAPTCCSSAGDIEVVGESGSAAGGRAPHPGAAPGRGGARRPAARRQRHRRVPRRPRGRLRRSRA